MTAIIKSTLLSENGFPEHGFTTGVNFGFDTGTPEETRKHLEALKASINTERNTERPLLRVKQVHGTGLVDADALIADGAGDWTAAPSVEADGILSGASDAFLAVQTADCVPILMGSTATGEVAAIHAGWRGLSKGIVRMAVQRFKRNGSAPETIFVAIGPSICIQCYEVGEEVANCFPESCDPVKRQPGKFMLDLRQAAEVSLIGAGLTTPHIEVIDQCTSCGDADLFSYRKSGGDCGRQLSFISR